MSVTQHCSEEVLWNIGLREPLETLADEFKFNVNFVAKVQRLSQEGYQGWRRVRGDGNCFYRAFGFALLERLVAEPPELRSLQALKLLRHFCRVELADESDQQAHQRVLECVERLGQGEAWELSLPMGMESQSRGGGCEGDDAVAALRRSLEVPGSELDLAFIRALRCLTAEHLSKHADDDDANGGISFSTVCVAQGYTGVDDFCRRVVLPLGVEAQDIVLNALPQALDIGLRVAILDRRESTELPFCDFLAFPGGDLLTSTANTADGVLDATALAKLVHLQLRPGHYDVLYYGQGT